MNFEKEICQAVCEGFRTRPVPIGYAISTPVSWFNGDNISFYARFDKDKARLEDSGDLLFDLEGQGFDAHSQSRRNLLSDLLDAHHVTFHEDDAIFSTDWVPKADVVKLVPHFLAFLTRIQDLLFLSRDRVKSTFKEDITSALKQRFGNNAQIDRDEAPVPELSQYIADIVIRHQNGNIGAVFPATSDIAVLQAVLLSKELELHHIENVTPFIVYEKPDTTRVSARNRAIAMNSELKLVSWQGTQLDALSKIERQLVA